uniref:Myrosinase 1 n=1 Tax=Steinernema glaseri TaxID=37863 RepID=A0A1I7XXV3_9BILA
MSRHGYRSRVCIGKLLEMSTSVRTLRLHESITAKCAMVLIISFSSVDLASGNVTAAEFPKDFLWSTATSAFQVEGGTVGTGRGKSIWDRYVEQNPLINDTAEVACDSYHKFGEDVKNLNKLKVKGYRFSISWPRIFPNGFVDEINEEGVRYYHKLIDLLLQNDITPMVTLYHWDLPLTLGDKGGWLNKEIVTWYSDYARFCFQEFGSKVKYWITVNEPYIHCVHGYCGDVLQFAPGGFKPHCEWTMYLAAHNILLAHGKAANIYKNDFQATQKGKIGITEIAMWFTPMTEGDEEVARRAFEHQFGWVTHPIFSQEGDYPPEMKTRMEGLAKQEGRQSSRLPKFTKKEIEDLRGSADFLGINYYFGFLATSTEVNDPNYVNMTGKSQWEMDAGVFPYYSSKWPEVGGKDSQVRHYPDGLYNVLNYVRKNYNNTPVYITENGVVDTPGEDYNDVTRIFYIRGHLQATQKAITKDGCNVKGYTYWSLMDNFEWSSGYNSKFGLYKVDFASSNKIRIPKNSVKWYRHVIENNAIVD